MQRTLWSSINLSTVSMGGFLDCTDTFWKNCPKAWQGLYKGNKVSKPSIVLEALSDYSLFPVPVAWIVWVHWHIEWQYHSFSMERLLDWTFYEIEEEAAVIPFEIMDE
jgi:hypothetical protein